jgi:hypothetical protein
MKTWTTRVLSLLTAAALFAATGGEALGLKRPCAHHEAAAAGSTHDAQAAPSPDDHAAHGAGAGEAEGGEHAAPCSCMGNCTVVAPAAAPVQGVERPLPAPVGRVTVRPAPVVPVVMVRIDHLIPLPTAPPLS